MTAPSTTAATHHGAEPGGRERAATAARLRLAVARLARRLRKQHSGGLSASQLSTLDAVECHGELRLGQLAALEGLSAPRMTRLVAGLTDAGLLDRRPDPVDGRSVHVSLSPAGQHILDQMRQDKTARLLQRLDHLSREDYARLVAALPVLETLLEDAPPEHS